MDTWILTHHPITTPTPVKRLWRRNRRQMWYYTALFVIDCHSGSNWQRIRRGLRQLVQVRYGYGHKQPVGTRAEAPQCLAPERQITPMEAGQNTISSGAVWKWALTATFSSESAVTASIAAKCDSKPCVTQMNDWEDTSFITHVSMGITGPNSIVCSHHL